jgi:hypothetical protein
MLGNAIKNGIEMELVTKLTRKKITAFMDC